MQAQLSVLAIVRRSLGVLVGNFGLFLVLAIVMAVPSTALTDWLTLVFLDLNKDMLAANGVIVDKQIAAILCMAIADLVALPWDLVVKTLAVAATIRVYMRASAGEDVTFGDTANYALNAFPRLFKPFAIAQLIIFVGSLVYIPGILYGLFYAFVAPVVLLDPGVDRVLRRSTRLTRGRRGRIFRAYLLFFPYWGLLAFFGPMVLPNQHFAVGYAAWTVNAVVWFVIVMAVLQLYLERMEQLQALIDQREADAASDD
jgi:hypothetical protein